MGEQRWSGDTDRILNAIEQSAKMTRDAAEVTRGMHQKSESRLERIEDVVRKHAEIFGQFLDIREGWKRLELEFSGANSLHVQFSNFRSDLAIAKGQMSTMGAQINAFELLINAIKQEHAKELRNLVERREQELKQMEERRERQEELETQREIEFQKQKQEHQNNNYKILGALITGIGAILLEIFKK